MRTVRDIDLCPSYDDDDINNDVMNMMVAVDMSMVTKTNIPQVQDLPTKGRPSAQDQSSENNFELSACSQNLNMAPPCLLNIMS